MGYAPDWNKGSMKKSGATPVKHGVVSRELFHGAKTVQTFADGGGVMGDMSRADMKYEAPKTDELNIKGQKVGAYEGNDEIVKYRMNMTEGVGGKSLRYKDNPDMMPEKPMPEARPYDSIDAIIEDKGTKNPKKSDDGPSKFIANQANKATAKITAPKVTRVTRDTSDEVAETEASTAYDRNVERTRLRDNAIEEGNKQTGEYGDARRGVTNVSPYRRNAGPGPEKKAESKPGMFSDLLRDFRTGMATTVRK